jgi:hypothetical protein
MTLGLSGGLIGGRRALMGRCRRPLFQRLTSDGQIGACHPLRLLEVRVFLAKNTQNKIENKKQH